MSKSKPAPVTPHDLAVDWAHVDVQHLEYGPGAMIFVQGDPATSVMYVEQGTVQLSVLSHAGKEAVIAVLEPGRFFGDLSARLGHVRTLLVRDDRVVG